MNEVHPNYPIELSIRTEEEEKKNISDEIHKFATEVGATKADLETALKKMDSTPDIENPIAWLKKALQNEVLNRELANRPKTPKAQAPKKDKKTSTASKAQPNKEKYEAFYL